MSIRTGPAGQFAFSKITPGSYFLVATRLGYFPGSYGQRLPSGRGVPIVVEEDSKLFAELRLRHKGAITGRILDENGVGAPGVGVVAYRAKLPLRSEASATSDDRGVFRIHGLLPGKYWVRSAGHSLEDGSGWQPRFAPQETDPKRAKVFVVNVDNDTPDADVYPQTGALYSLSGFVTCEAPTPVTITLNSETGQSVNQSYCSIAPAGYSFKNLPPGPYEVVAVAQDGVASAFSEVTLGTNLQMDLSLTRPPAVEVEAMREGGGRLDSSLVKLLGRRQNLSETGEPVEFSGPKAKLGVGFWELRAHLPGHYVQSIMNPRVGRQGRRATTSPTDWFEAFIDPHRQSLIRVAVSDQVSTVGGQAMIDGKAAPGVPVFLWPIEEFQRRSVGGYAQTIADTTGAFQFDGLPPGSYRVLASFDVLEVDAEMMERAAAEIIRCEPRKTVSLQLKVWMAPY